MASGMDALKQCYSFEHLGNGPSTHTVILWELELANGRVQRLVSFDHGAKHGNWERLLDSSDNIEAWHIRYHYAAVENLSMSHQFLPITHAKVIQCILPGIGHGRATQFLLPHVMPWATNNDKWPHATYGLDAPACLEPGMRQQCHAFQHSTGNWLGPPRSVILWRAKINGKMLQQVSFDHGPKHGNWLVIKDSSDNIEACHIRYHYAADDSRACCHLFLPIPYTTGFLCTHHNGGDTAFLMLQDIPEGSIAEVH